MNWLDLLYDIFNPSAMNCAFADLEMVTIEMFISLFYIDF
jgi:hypothetical protein